MVVTSSSAVYAPSEEPLAEESPIRHGPGYVESKLAAEAICAEWASRLRIVGARPFNHTGPGQPPVRVVPALARSVLAAASTAGPVIAGNLDVERDITDVRDVAGLHRVAEAGQGFSTSARAKVSSYGTSPPGCRGWLASKTRNSRPTRT